MARFPFAISAIFLLTPFSAQIYRSEVPPFDRAGTELVAEFVHDFGTDVPKRFSVQSSRLTKSL
ncbi:MAG: hypothetical protein PCFJNLEI_03880 [Verrucomicrobiae bacterium]|nr:hypothetical protein [Verrucomicrobiae bacterium]